MAFSIQVPRQRMWLQPTGKATSPLSVAPFNAKIQLQHAKFKNLPHPQLTIVQKKHRTLEVVEMSKTDSNMSRNSLSPTDTIKLFYSSINNKNLEQLDKLIGDDCFFEDYSFPEPFQGKQETMRFFERLTKSMGKNMEFIVEQTFEGDGHTVGVNWHLDWKKKQVPFTRGCSYYELVEDGEKLVIKKATVVIESVIKPGELVLVLCEKVSSIFDAWPREAECFLRCPPAIFQLLSNPQAMIQLLRSPRMIFQLQAIFFLLLNSPRTIFKIFVGLLKKLWNLLWTII